MGGYSSSCVSEACAESGDVVCTGVVCGFCVPVGGVMVSGVGVWW